MTLLVVLGVYAGHAAEDSSDGPVFAVVYAMLLALLAVQWAGVRRRDTELFAALTRDTSPPSVSSEAFVRQARTGRPIAEP